MKKVTFAILAIAGIILSVPVFSQTKVGRICFIRTNGYVGSMVNNSVFIDSSRVCKLKNNQYSIHDVAAGEHTVAVEDSGISNHKKSSPFKVQVEEGKTTYVNVVWANNITCEEITQSSAEVKLKKAKKNTTCLQ